MQEQDTLSKLERQTINLLEKYFLEWNQEDLSPGWYEVKGMPGFDTAREFAKVVLTLIAEEGEKEWRKGYSQATQDLIGKIEGLRLVHVFDEKPVDGGPLSHNRAIADVLSLIKGEN